MSANDNRLIDAAALLSDGEKIDWENLERSAADGEERAAIRGLRLLESISAVHRTGTAGKVPIDTKVPTVADPLGVDGEHDRTIVDFPAPEPDELGNWIHLELKEKIGEGSFGEVYRARDTRLDREVALKLLRVRSDQAREKATSVIREGRLMAKIRHPNVVSVHGAEDHDGSIGVWMEFVRGRSLEALLKDQGTFGAREASLIGIDLCRALAAVHKAGLVHRDVKAQNVMRAEGGRVLLMDFGAGWDVAEEDTGAESSISGTPLYMAPETFINGVTTIRSDIYSLGVLLYHLVTQSYPVVGSSVRELRQAHIRHEASLLRDERSDLPEAFISVIERALAWSPDDRFATAGQMEQALQATLGMASGLKARVATRSPFENVVRRRALIPLAAAAAVLVVVVVGWIALQDRTGPEAPQIAAKPPATGVAVTSSPSFYTVEASLVRVKDGGRRERLQSGSRLALGDDLALELEASQSLYVYVINEDEAGHAYALFPLPDLDLKNPLPAGTTHRLPGTRAGKQNAWKVTTAGGREHLLIVASPERLVEFEAEMAALPRPRTGQAAVAVPKSALVHLRGLGGLSEVATEVERGSAGRLFDMADDLATTAERVEGAWVRRIVLENPPQE